MGQWPQVRPSESIPASMMDSAFNQKGGLSDKFCSFRTLLSPSPAMLLPTLDLHNADPLAQMPTSPSVVIFMAPLPQQHPRQEALGQWLLQVHLRLPRTLGPQRTSMYILSKLHAGADVEWR